MSTDTSKKVPLQQRKGSSVTVKMVLPICRRWACSFSEMIARMLVTIPLFDGILVFQFSQYTTKQTKEDGKNKSG